MSKEYSKKDYKNLMDELMSMHAMNPKKAEKEAHRSLLKMGKARVTVYNNILYRLPLLFLLVIVVMNAVTTYHNSAQVATGLFGLLFFAAGYFISCSEAKGGATVALFSHGLTGFCIMNSLPAMHILHSPLMSDVSETIGVWIIAALATLILSLFFGLLNSLIPEFRENPIKKSLAFAFAAISTIIIQVLAIHLGF